MWARSEFKPVPQGLQQLSKGQSGRPHAISCPHRERNLEEILSVETLKINPLY